MKSKWPVVVFGDAVEDVTGGNPKLANSDYLSLGQYPVIDQGQEFISGYSDDSSLLCRRKGELIVFGDHTKAFKFVDFDFVLGADGVKVLKTKDGFDPKFVYYFLRKFRFPENVGYSRHFKFLKECLVPKPPLGEQKRIAAILDKADSLRRKRAQAIALADDFLRATFLEMFGESISVKQGWPCVELGNLVVINPRVDRSKISEDDEVSFLPMASVSEQGYVAFEECRVVAEVKKGFTYFERGDILFAKITPCMENGKAAYLHSLSTAYGFGSTEFHVLRPGIKVNPWFIFYLVWNDHFRMKAARAMKGAAGQKRVGADYLRSFILRLPPKDIQDKFGGIVGQVKNMLNKSVCASEMVEDLGRSLEASIFSRIA